MINVFQGMPWEDNGPGKRKLVDSDSLLVMQISLKPGQAVARHEANSNVHLLILRGSPTVVLNDQKIAAREGDLVPVAFRTPMEILNNSRDDVLFLVWKTPHPDRMKK